MESGSGEEFMQPTKMMEVENQMKQEDCQPIHVDKKVSDHVFADVSLDSTSLDGVNASKYSTCLSYSTSGSSRSSDSYIKSIQPSSRSHSIGSQCIPGLTRHSDKTRDLRDLIMEENGRRMLTNNH